MKARIVLLVAIASWVGGALVASAEPRSISVQGGPSSPVGDLADGVGDGAYMGASVSQPIGNAGHSLFLDFNYHVLGDKTQSIFGELLSARQSARITETAIGVRIPLALPRARVSPYLKVGGALEFVEPKVEFITPSQTTIVTDPRFKPGVLAALGVSIRLGASTGLRLEGMYRLIATDTNQTADVGTLGLALWSAL